MATVTERLVEELEIDATLQAEENWQEMLTQYYGVRAQAHIGADAAPMPEELQGDQQGDDNG